MASPARGRRRCLKDFLKDNPEDGAIIEEEMRKEEFVHMLTHRCLQSLTPMLKTDRTKDNYPYFVSCARHYKSTLYNTEVLSDCMRVRLRDYNQVPKTLPTAALRNYCHTLVHKGLQRNADLTYTDPTNGALSEAVRDVVRQEYLQIVRALKEPFKFPKYQ